MITDQHFDSLLEKPAQWLSKVVFFEIPVSADQKAPFVLALMLFTGIFLTLFFKFINLRAFGIALKTVRGKYTEGDREGEITHFQALSAALSATVGLGNIAGVALAIGVGGPGATFWMIVMGLIGMTTKFCECTLGVKYRKVDADGVTHGGAMYYLSAGLREIGFGTLGKVLAVFFAIMCIGGTIGAGNMFQANQAFDQFHNTFGMIENGWLFGLIMAIIVALVIIGGIRSIANVAAKIVPLMCGIYVLGALVVLAVNFGKIPEAFVIIFREAFSPSALAGGGLGAFIVAFVNGVKRGVFSNEAGFGSAPIAHSAVRTNHPASEGLVALLEPFIDTVVICTMTALVIVSTGMWKVNATLVNGVENGVEKTYLRNSPAAKVDFTIAKELKGDEFLRILETSEDKKWHRAQVIDKNEIKLKNPEASDAIVGWIEAEKIVQRSGTKGGIWLTSNAFSTVIDWFPYVLTIAVILFAFSTMISWSYYGEQAVVYLFGRHDRAILIYKLLFCIFVVVGSAASLQNVLLMSDGMVFAMIFPNLIGVYLLLPVVKKEVKKYFAKVEEVESREK